MKNQLSLFVSIFLLVGQLQAQTQIPSYVPTNGLVGWWPFNGNANDESGNGNNGVVYASTVLTTDRYNVLSKAYLFNGTTQSAITNSLQLSNTSTGLAASVWFNSNIALNTSAGHRMFISGTNNIPYQFAYNNSGIDLELYNSSGALTVYTIPITFLANTWNHVVFSTNTNGSVLIYINGVMYNAGNAPSSFRSTNNSKYMFGLSSSAFWPVPFNGKLDDIGIWNRALTQQEVNELYTSSDPFDVSATTTTICAGQPTTLSVQSLPGTITSLTCASATNNGSLTAGVAASGVSSTIPYTGGNGGAHNGQTVTSTGVTGLTATLTSGTFASGNGSLTYTISGTPSASGTASFALNIGGQTCTLSRTVAAGTITGLTCASATNNGTLTAGVAASGVNSVVPYAGGNGGFHNGQTVTSTGVTGLTATLTSGTFASGSGSLTYTITGNPSASGTASFALNIGGQTCILTRTVVPGSITSLTCASATNNGTLVAGAVASGVSSSIPYTGGNGGLHNGQTVTSTGVTGLTATLTTGTFAIGAGNLTYTITGTPATGGTASFALTIGGQTCTLTRTVGLPTGTISALSCGTATNSGTLISGTQASNVSFTIPYSGGNGGSYSAQTISGNTGYSASISAGNFSTNTGSLTYSVSGVSYSGSDVSFIVNIGGQSCNLTINILPSSSPLYPLNSIFCGNGPTEVIDVTNPTTGKTWMDRNLGATRVATSSTDASSYGDLYQWGRRSDGHQCRNSTTTTILSSTDQPGNGNFIIGSSDWRNPQNNNLWQGVNGVNNPCPSGYRLPTETELNAELLSWSSNNSAGAFASPLKLPSAGYRLNFGLLENVGTIGYYWSSTVSSASSLYLRFNGSNPGMNSNNRAYGTPVRCLKD
jgi:uncharacterized protein (TIGR02145 family)